MTVMFCIPKTTHRLDRCLDREAITTKVATSTARPE